VLKAEARVVAALARSLEEHLGLVDVGNGRGISCFGQRKAEVAGSASNLESAVALGEAAKLISSGAKRRLQRPMICS
jgi:hypothetical protein